MKQTKKKRNRITALLCSQIVKARSFPSFGPSRTCGVTRGTHYLLGPVAGAAAATAFQLVQIEAQAQIALQQLTILATITVGKQCCNNSLQQRCRLSLPC
ncbi:hypothetical protein LDENG_00070680 [Lucifuga dentata]|nr:hypothetical protein LDENG_00070680 [Lucifuga dentata]